MSAAKKKVVLLSIDGWGVSSEKRGNAILEAKTPVMDELSSNASQYAEINASGLHVGLPAGVMGNSEVGHLTMGAGRANFQDLVRINATIEDGSFHTNEVLVNAFNNAKNGNGRLHFLGLVSDGGVHSHINHLMEFLKSAKNNDVPNTFVHFFGDGRDTPPKSGHIYVKQLQDFIGELGYAEIATVIGRYYAMDRDKRWERIELAYEALCNGVGEECTQENLISLVHARHELGQSDEFLKPIILNKDGCIKDGDTMVFIDFRADRMRQIVETFGVKPPFDTATLRQDLHIVQMTRYNHTFDLPVLYPPQSMDNVLAEWISKKGLHQFHTAETEKYAHVTFFFNGGREVQFENEERKLVPSPKVATYDLQPEMSMSDVRDAVIEAMETEKYAFIMLNIAPPDMVGHTGVYDATVIACTATDVIVGELLEACKKHGYVFVVTADHGNAETMLEPDGKPRTAHTTNLIPLIVAGDDSIKLKPADENSGLKDVAPTVLDIMGLPIPEEMTGKSLLDK